MSHNHEHSYRLGEKSAWLGIISNILLFVVKFLAGIFGRSHAMIADALHTASDAVTSVGVFVGFRIAQKPADKHHPFGHGRAESIVAKIISIVLFAVGLEVAYVSAKVLLAGDIAEPHIIAAIVAIISVVVKEYTYRRVNRTSKEINSTSLKADAYHHRSDVLSSIVAFVGIVGAKMGYPLMDPLAGIVVAGFIIKMSAETFHIAYDELMDAAPPDEFMDKINNAIKTVEGVEEIKKTMVRKAGIEFLAEITIGVAGEKTVEEGHTVTVKIKRELFRIVPEVKDVIVHVEPS